jgi:hypothetical protein
MNIGRGGKFRDVAGRNLSGSGISLVLIRDIM